MIRNYGDVLSQMDTFLKKVAAEKQAADDSAKTEPQGATSKTVASAAAAQGAAGSEKASDLKAAVGGVTADSAQATVKPGDGTQFADTQGPNSLAADEPVDEGDNMIQCTEIQKEARASVLANSLLARIGAMAKTAADESKGDFIQKIAAENPALANELTVAFHDFACGYLRGLEKKAQDITEVVQSGFTKTAQEAEDQLDAVAMTDPAAVAPEEAYVAEEAAAAPAEEQVAADEAAALDEVAAVMAEQGVQPEEILQAAAEIEQLKEAGFTDEDIIQASAEIADEAAAAEQAAAAPAPELEKQAAARVEILKQILRGQR